MRRGPLGLRRSAARSRQNEQSRYRNNTWPIHVCSHLGGLDHSLSLISRSYSGKYRAMTGNSNRAKMDSLFGAGCKYSPHPGARAPAKTRKSASPVLPVPLSRPPAAGGRLAAASPRATIRFGLRSPGREIRLRSIFPLRWSPSSALPALPLAHTWLARASGSCQARLRCGRAYCGAGQEKL